jgi:hypothetical protein
VTRTTRKTRYLSQEQAAAALAEACEQGIAAELVSPPSSPKLYLYLERIAYPVASIEAAKQLISRERASEFRIVEGTRYVDDDPARPQWVTYLVLPEEPWPTSITPYLREQ